MTARKHNPAADREIARFREIAAAAGNSLLLADGGSCSPDAALLDLCAEAIHLLTHSERTREASFAITVEPWTATQRPRAKEQDRLWNEYNDLVKQAKPVLSRIRKLRATTGPGIYAKAMVIRASRTGAPVLAKSLAEDLIACKELRATLWPATD